MNSESENVNAYGKSSDDTDDDGKNACMFFLKGKKHADDNDHVKAVMLFEKAIKLEPKKGSIREALATAYFNCGLYDAAEKHFRKALQIDAANDFAHYGLGLCLAKEGRVIKAMGHLKLANAMTPSNKNYSDAIVKYNRIFDTLHTGLPRLKEGQ